MQFLPPTQAALDEYLSLDDQDLEWSLLTMGDSAARIVPECVGLSLTLYDQDLTFTLVAPSFPPDELDAGQLLDVGPSARASEDHDGGGEPLDEDSWALFARSSAATGVASSLSLPVLDHGRVVGDINLYASSAEAFSGHHGDLAAALGASASGAVTNADLEFETRRRAEQAPRVLREQQVVEVGVGILAAREGLDVDDARGRLREAAGHAGISEAQAALVLMNVHRT